MDGPLSTVSPIEVRAAVSLGSKTIGVGTGGAGVDAGWSGVGEAFCGAGVGGGADSGRTSTGSGGAGPVGGLGTSGAVLLVPGGVTAAAIDSASLGGTLSIRAGC